MTQFPEALLPLTQYKQFIIYRLSWNKTLGKNDKLPVNPSTLHTASAHDPALWLDAEAALRTAALFGEGYGVGFTFTEKDPFFFLDIDHCILDGVYTPIVTEILRYLPGAAIEVSQSGAGLHVFGKASPIPHGCRNEAEGLELYTEKRFVAFTGCILQGSAGAECDLYFPALVQRYFTASAGSVETTEWTETPCAAWSGPEEDEVLIEKALQARSAGSVFGGRASFADLWLQNTDVLAKAYPTKDPLRDWDYSTADAALAQHLAFWTGKNCERMQRLMLLSGLYRDKWAREDYLPRTITKAVSMQEDVYNNAPVLTEKADEVGAGKLRGSPAQIKFAEKVREQILSTATPEQAEVLVKQQSAKFWIDNKAQPAEKLASAITPVQCAETAMASAEARLVTGYQYLSADAQLEYFKGCVYIQDINRMFTPSGALVRAEQFNASYGGYVFQLDELGDKTTRKAYEAFTESQVTRLPKAHTSCFRTDLPPGAIVQNGALLEVNTYVPPNTPRTPGDASPFLVHLAKLLPDANDHEILLSYMAACVQYKGVKFQWAPLIQGAEGNGKTLLTDCVAYAIGRQYTHYADAKDIDNKFNGWLLNKLFIGVEDIYVPDGRREVIEALKPMITSRNGIGIQLKGADQVTKTICCNFMFNSNYKDAIRKVKTDRRFCVFYSAQQSDEDIIRDGMDGEYFSRLYDWLRAGGYAVVNHFLSTYSIPYRYNPATGCQRAPTTTSTSEALIASMGGIEQEIIEAVEEGRPGFSGGWVSSVALDAMLTMMRAGRAMPPAKRIDLLKGLGYIKHPGLPDGRVTGASIVDGGKRPRLFIKKEHPTKGLIGAAEILKAYTDAQTNSGG